MSTPATSPEIAQVQRQILDALRAGASFSTCHKEGGTNLVHENGRFVRIDFGDCPDRVVFADEAAFFASLRKFYDWETSGAADELERWKMIRQRLQRRSASAGRGNSPLQWVLAFLIAVIAVTVLYHLRGGLFWFLRPSAAPEIQRAPEILPPPSLRQSP